MHKGPLNSSVEVPVQMEVNPCGAYDSVMTPGDLTCNYLNTTAGLTSRVNAVGSVHLQGRVCVALSFHVGILHGVLYDHEDGSYMFRRIVFPFQDSSVLTLHM
jgi:hypothetical protein